jgi:hypothetical protein
MTWPTRLPDMQDGGNMTKKASSTPSCTDCVSLNCYRQAADFPPFCLTSAADDSVIEEVNKILPT